MKLFLAIASCVLFSTASLADTYTFTKTNNRVAWVAVGTPGFLRINGVGGASEGTLTTAAGRVSGDLTVSLDSYRTGVELRDKHMKEKYLEVAKFPTAKLSLTDQPLTEGKESSADALLTIKGVTKPVKLTYTLTGKALTAKFKINIKDYPSLGVPSHLGVTVADEVEVKVDATL